MEKFFTNKKNAYALIGILSALQLTQSIANWCGGGFNGGSLILCIMMLGLLMLVGVGISKKNKLLTIVCGVSILSVVIYVITSECSGLIQRWIDGEISISGLITNIFGSLGALLFIGCFILVILKAFKVNKNLKVINNIFSLIAFVVILVSIVIPMVTGVFTDSTMNAFQKVYLFGLSFFAIFIALLIPCVWYQLEEIKE